MSKGSWVVVVGRLQQRAWMTKDGSARQVVEVVAGTRAETAMGGGDDDQDHAEQRAVASSTSDATSGT